MKLFDKYIIKQFSLPFITVIVGFVMLFVLFDFSGRLDDFIKQKLTPFEILFFYYLYVPQMVVVTMPVSLLLSIFYSFGRLCRNREIFALRVAGISLKRISGSLFVISILCVLTVFLINEHFVTKTYAETGEFIARIKGRDKKPDQIKDRVFSYGGGTLLFKEFDTKKNLLRDITWDRPSTADNTGIWLHADRGKWIGGQWWLFDVNIVYPNDVHSPLHPKRRMYDWYFTPKDLASEKKVQEMTFIEIWRRINTDPDSITDKKRQQMKLQLNQKLALPLLNLLVVFIGMPLCLKTKASGSAFIGLALSLGMSFGYYGLFLIGKTLGDRAILPAWLAIWYPTILFMVFAAILVARMEK